MLDIVNVTIKGHGTHTVTSAALDMAMLRYLPSNPARLRAIVEERTASDWSDVEDVSTFVIVLADFDFNVDDSALSVGAAR